MADELTRAQQAAAFHGMALNQGRPRTERLELALEALYLYEVETERLLTELENVRNKFREANDRYAIERVNRKASPASES